LCKKIDLLLQRREDNRFSRIDLMVMETAPKPQNGREDRQNGDDTHNKPLKTQYSYAAKEHIPSWKRWRKCNSIRNLVASEESPQGD